jgi:hypothetical protein
MKNIQKQYTDLLEGKMSKQNFMRNVRMEFPQHVTNVSSFEDTVKILKGKRILSEAAKPEGVYGHNPNAETPPVPGIDQLNYYQVYHGIQYELAQMPEITDEAYIKARKKVVDTILKDPDAYKQLQLANFKAVKAMDQDLKMKEVKENNLTDKPNEMKVVKKDAKANTEDTLEKKEKKKAKNPKGVAVMTQTPKKAKGIAKVMEVPGKEKSLNEAISPIASQWKVGTKFKNLKNNQVTTIEKFDNSGNVIISTDAMPGKSWTWPAEELSNMIKKGELELMHTVRENRVKALKENIMREMTIQNPTYEHFQVGARVKKKDDSLVGEITEWDGDTATIKTDEGEIHHVQGNVLTKGDIPAKEDTSFVNPKAHVPEDVEKVEESKEERDSKLRSLKEKLMKVVREVAKVTDEKGTVVALKANAADAQEFVQGQETAVKSKLKVTA